MFLLLLFLLAQQVSSHLYEGDRCTDTRTGCAGRCEPLSACQSAQDDLRNRKGTPDLCSFSGSVPVVCCAGGCAGGGGDPERFSQGLRKSELMCSQYLSMVRPFVVPEASKPPRPIYVTLAPDNRTHFSLLARTRRQLSGGGDGFFRPAAVGGVNTELDEFPHMAAIGWALKAGGFAFNCGGSLISERFVLTAGHCLRNGRDSSLTSPEPAIVRLGDQNILDSVIDGAQPLDIGIMKRIKHPNYQPPIKYFDIALLELNASVTFSKHIQPTCLWTKPDFESHTFAFVTGWGTTVSGGRVGSAVLQKVKVDILATDVCQPLLQSSHNRNWWGFSDHQLCAGVLVGGKDACQGDSGGPLQISKRMSYIKHRLIGVTSFGRECGKPNLPGVYSRVSSFVDWIESVVWP